MDPNWKAEPVARELAQLILTLRAVDYCGAPDPPRVQTGPGDRSHHNFHRRVTMVR